MEIWKECGQFENLESLKRLKSLKSLNKSEHVWTRLENGKRLTTSEQSEKTYTVWINLNMLSKFEKLKSLDSLKITKT